MRNIQIYVQTSPDEIDSAIEAMHFLIDLKEVERKVNFEVTFYTSFDEFTEKHLTKSPTRVKDFFVTAKQKEAQMKEEYERIFDEKDDSYLRANFNIPIARKKKYHYMPVDKVVFGFCNKADLEKPDDPDQDKFDISAFMSFMFCNCVKVEPEFGCSEPSAVLLYMFKQQSQVPNNGGFEFDNEDSLKINILLHLLALKVLYTRYVKIQNGKVYYRSLYIGDLSKTRYSLDELLPTFEGFKSEDSNKLVGLGDTENSEISDKLKNVDNHDINDTEDSHGNQDDANETNDSVEAEDSLGLKDTDDSDNSDESHEQIDSNTKGAYNNSINTNLSDNSKVSDSIDSKVGAGDMDPFYRGLFERAIVLAAMSYCWYMEVVDDCPIHCRLVHIYDKAKYDKLNLMKDLYGIARDASCERQYQMFINAKNQDIIDFVQFANTKLEVDAEARAKKIEDGEINENDRLSTKYCQKVFSWFDYIIDYARSYDCDPEIWNYIFVHYFKFLMENRLYRKAFPMTRPWIQMCRKHIDRAENPFYHCYYAGFNLMPEFGLWDEFVEYGNKYINYCFKDQERDSWGGCTDAAVSLTGYYLRKKDFNRALSSVKVAKKAFQKYEEEWGEDPVKRANLLALYAHVHLNKGFYEIAEKTYLEVLKLYYQYQNRDTRELSITYNNLGTCYTNLGKNEKAVEYQLKSADIIRKLYGEEDPTLYVIYSNIAYCYTDLEKDQEAERYTDMAEKIRLKHNIDPSILYIP